MRRIDLLLIALLLAPSARAQGVLVLDDPLRSATLGTASGGALEAGGWRVTATSDYVYWHIPTLLHGAVEFSVRGLNPQEGRAGIEDKSELFHMYDWTYDSADTNYTGYRNNPFKHFVRKTGIADTRPGKTDAMELVWVIAPNYTEPDTGVLDWDPAVSYRFREEWGPDGAGNSVIRTFRDGVQIMEMSEPGDWLPTGHAIRIGVARLAADAGAPLDAVFSDLQVWDLSGVDPGTGLTPADPDAAPLGQVRVVANSLVDDNGAFLGLGATYMTALWQCKNNRGLLESDLDLLRSRGFNYIRILAQVGGASYWGGLEIVPVDMTDGDSNPVAPWPDYWQQLLDLLDLVYARGLRTEITIFGSGDLVVGGAAARQSFVEALLGQIRGREHEIILIEVANEGWQTGFPGAAGLDEMKGLARLINDSTDVPVAVTSNHEVNTPDQVYVDANADIATWHFSRDVSVDEGWGPVYDSWFLETLPSVPPGSSNEPVGPGSSVDTETRPIRLVMAAAFAWVAKLPMYVYHTSAGVRHQVTFESMAGVDDFASIRHILPGDVASWTRNDGKEAAAPFTVYAGDQADRYWPEVGSNDGCVRNIGARKGTSFVALPMGIRPDGLTLAAREPLSFKVYHPLTGALVEERALATGEQFTLPQGPEAYVLTNAEPPELGDDGTGLSGQYFGSDDLSQPVLARLDPTVNFDWGTEVPAPGVGVDNFSVRWIGQVLPRFTEQYTFYSQSDDGTRLWVNGQQLIDDWNEHGLEERSGSVALSAGTRVDIRLEYFDRAGPAAVTLLWSSPSRAKQIVPRSQLFPPAATDAGSDAGTDAAGPADAGHESGPDAAIADAAPDAGHQPGADATVADVGSAAGSDSGVAAVEETGGCGCQTTPGAPGSTVIFLLLGGVAMLELRRSYRSAKCHRR